MIEKPKRKKKRKKGDDWEEIKPFLQDAFIKAGIYPCELKYAKCTMNNFTWSFAHSYKQAKIVKPKFRTPKAQKQYEKRILEIIIVCNPCHEDIEKIGNKYWVDDSPTMRDVVREVISEREFQPIIIEQILEILKKI